MQSISAASERRFSWGQFDCFIFCAEVIKAMTGEDIFKDYEFRKKYKSAKGAIKQFRRHGFLNIEAIWDHFATPIGINYAQRGDLILIEEGQELPAVGPVVDSRAAFLSLDGLTYRKVNEARCAWRIGD